ncbi:MAG: hypothetical protein VX871_10335 [Pseudomonadota bacterium]|nr:hypothetical protein [Pseudomonadota bacterium]
MSRETHEYLDAAAPPLPSERSTGLVFTGVCLVLAVLLRGHAVLMFTLLAAAAAFLAASLLRPALLGPLNRVWFRLSLLMHRVVSPVVMFVIFVLVFVPVGLLMNALRDPLHRRRQGGEGTYWMPRDGAADAPSSMRNQF